MPRVSGSTPDDERDALLDRLVSERDIRNLVAKVAQLADDGEVDDYLDLWTDDASWIYEGVAHSGRDALRRRVLDFRGNAIQGPGTGTRHLNTTLWVSFDDDDHARGESYFVFLRDANSGRPEVGLTGRYLDRFVRTADGWRFAEREIVSAVN
jgi:uncharacterized protein (TIGR02246 family)